MSHPQRIITPNALEDTYMQIERGRQLNQKIKTLTKELDEIKNNLKAGHFLHSEEFIYEGGTIATYKSQVMITLDQKRLKLERPDLVKEYEKIESIRKFLFT